MLKCAATMNRSTQSQLATGLTELGLSYKPEQVDQLLAFIRLLEKWNRVFNLLGEQDSQRILGYHLLDSLAVAPHLRGPRVLDVGSGAGLPGIPLAIMKPDMRFTLLDSNGKKTRFLKQAVIELSLSERVQVIKSRIEEYRPAQSFDTVISRAFASLGDFAESCLHLCDQHSIILAMKGRRPDSEMSTLQSGVEVVSVTPITVPGVVAERHIVYLKKKSD
jgi:16S rRNA (guanine527-N7)-methyltransferase